MYYASTQDQAKASDKGRRVLESWQYIPPSMTQESHLGEPLGPMTLTFTGVLTQK
jgi:hypothetical protein